MRWIAATPATSVISDIIASTTYQRSTRKTHSSTSPMSRSWTTVQTAASRSRRSSPSLSSTEIAPLIRISSAARRDLEVREFEVGLGHQSRPLRFEAPGPQVDRSGRSCDAPAPGRD